MRTTALLIAVLSCLGAWAGVPVETLFEETWDDYSPGRDDPGYVENWATLEGTLRYEITEGPLGLANVWSEPYGLRIRKEVAHGITHNLTPEINAVMPGAVEVNGTDEHPLKIFFIVDFNRSGGQTQDIFVELSKGDVHVDDRSGEEKPVIAFGMTNGLLGPAYFPRVFNGFEWVDATNIVTDKRFNHFTLEIMSDTLVITGSQRASGSQEIERIYTGGFDRISIRTVFNTHRAHIFDNLLIQGGEVSGGEVKVLFKRGDSNIDGGVNIADAVWILSYLFAGGKPLDCMDAGDANDDGKINIADAVTILGHLFGGEGPLPVPFDECGTDETEDELGCERFPPCGE